MSLLKLKNVTYRYESTTKDVLKNVNAEFEKGNLYVIQGKSGAGKTTLLSLISGLDTCSDGEVLFEDRNVKNINRDDYRAKSIGVIFQGYNLLLNVTAIENIILSMNISGSQVEKKKEYAYKLLETVGIDKETADRKVLKLSGGEQQRVGIARALSHEPGILIADEPTGNIDPGTEKEIMEIFKNLAHKNDICVIIVTHSKKVAEYADEIWGISNGRILFVK